MLDEHKQMMIVESVSWPMARLGEVVGEMSAAIYAASQPSVLYRPAVSTTRRRRNFAGMM